MFSRFKGALLSWVAIPVSVGVFFLSLMALILISYYPIAPGVHLIPVRTVLSAMGVLACIVLAIRHSRMKRRTLVFRNAMELTAVPVTLWIALQICAAIYQQPDHLRLAYGGETYSIPRVYSPRSSPPRSSSKHTSHDFIFVKICEKTGAPVYEHTCHGTVSVTLSSGTMLGRFSTHRSLKKAGATYDGDVITNRGSGARELPDGSFTYSKGVPRTRFLLDESGQIERLMRCRSGTETCTIVARTPQGILTFPARATDTGATNFWRDEEADWLAAFDSWKCAEATCGDRFD